MLNPQEREAATDATTRAVNGGVGSSSSWTSPDRVGVSGSSTVTAETRTSDGAVCRNMSDVIIVNGEETTVVKQMCRAPGATGFSLVS